METGAILVTPVNDSVLEGGAVITGIENNPTTILVTVETSRPLYQQYPFPRLRCGSNNYPHHNPDLCNPVAVKKIYYQSPSLARFQYEGNR